ncbi:hypothetical protein, partial [Escherichia coli]|uniref:hypothetical protein n=1 Tax=Escherichia coli TaxID=562 RepID=UPI00196A2E5A
RESANYIGARSFRAAIKPDIKLQPTVDVRTMDAFANGMRSYNRLWQIVQILLMKMNNSA